MQNSLLKPCTGRDQKMDKEARVVARVMVVLSIPINYMGNRCKCLLKYRQSFVEYNKTAPLKCAALIVLPPIRPASTRNLPSIHALRYNLSHSFL